MVASTGVMASPSQGVAHFEKARWPEWTTRTGERVEGDAVTAIDDLGRPDVDVALIGIEDARGRARADLQWEDMPLAHGSFEVGDKTGSTEARFHGSGHWEAASANQASLPVSDAGVVPEDILRLDSDERLSRHGRTTLFTGDFWNVRHICTTSDSNGRVSVVSVCRPAGRRLVYSRFLDASQEAARTVREVFLQVRSRVSRTGRFLARASGAGPSRLEPRHSGQRPS